MTLFAKTRAFASAACFIFLAQLQLAAAADFGAPYSSGPSYDIASERRPFDGSLRAYSPATAWTGLYAGGHIGWAAGSSDATGAFNRSTDIDGALAGGHIGYNFQSGSLVAGVEGDIDWSGVDGAASLSGGASTGTSMDWLSSMRLRLGWTTGNWLLYGTAGFAFAGLDTTVAGPGADSQTSDIRSGYAFGAGAEIALTQSVSARLEALHYSFGEEHMQTSRGSIDADTGMTTVRGGLSIKLN